MDRRLVLAALICLLMVPSVLSCAPANVPLNTVSAYTGDNFTTGKTHAWAYSFTGRTLHSRALRYPGLLLEAHQPCRTARI